MARVTTAVIGTGGFGRGHIRRMLAQKRSTRIVGLVETSEKQREETQNVFVEAKAACPPYFDSIRAMVHAQGVPDTVCICTPHSLHKQQIIEALQAGIDVLIEKPMVLNAAEARAVIRARDRTGRVLSVAFPGSYSPAIRLAKKMIQAGEIGRVTAISAYCHQHWKARTTGTWRQDPAISGGGFLFDTGSHMVNTVVDLADSAVSELNATLDTRGTPVEILSAVSGRFASGAVFTLCAAGESINCQSGVVVMGDAGVLLTGIWGETLQIIRAGRNEAERVALAPWRGLWDHFLKVRAGRLPNPCPAECGLRFASLMDLVRQSAASGTVARAKRR